MGITENPIYRAALKNITITGLQGKSILITGATGMIGSCLVDALMFWNETQREPCRVTAVSRNTTFARERFSRYWSDPNFLFVEQDICQEIKNFPSHTDYILHAASGADPISFAREPVDVLLANIVGTERLIRYGMHHGMTRFLYVSSGEMYGQPSERLDDFSENYCGPIDHSSARACYPAGKRAAEILCQCYIQQYQVDAVIVRPCHIFGPTMTMRDSRAVSEFLRNAAAGKDIVLKSAGLTERSHCYVLDAAQAVFMVLMGGVCAAAYNIADTAYQMTIREFALQAAQAGGCDVIFELPSNIEQTGYSKVIRSVLNAEKLRKLGWEPKHTGKSAIQETVNILRQSWYMRE